MALLVHDKANSTTGDGFTSAAKDTTGGKFIVVNVSLGTNSGALADSYLNSWSPLTQGVDSFGDRWSQLFHCINPTVGPGHTFSVSGTGNHPALSYAVFDDIVTAFDVENNNANGFSSSTTTGSVTPSVDNELLITGLAYDDSPAATIDSSFIVTDANPQTGFGWTGNALAYLFETTATAKNPTWSWVSGARNVAVIAAFKVSAGAAAVPLGTSAPMFAPKLGPRFGKFKPRLAFPAPGGTVALQASSFAKAFGNAGASGKAGITAFSVGQAKSRAQPTGTTPLAGKASAQAKSAGQYSLAALMTARAKLAAASRMTFSGFTSIAARATTSAKSNLLFSGVASFTGRAMTAVKASMLFAGTTSLAGNGVTRISARLSQAAGTASLAARTAVNVFARLVPPGAVALVGRAFIAAKSAAAASGVTGLSARSSLRVMARLVPPGAIALLGAAFARLTARSSTPTGTTPLAGKATTNVLTLTGPGYTTGLQGATRTSAKSLERLSALAQIVTATKLVSVARSGMAASTSLTGRTQTGMKASGAVTAIAAMTAIAARTSVRLVVRGVLALAGLFVGSPRIATVPAEDRNASVPSESRTAFVSSEGRSSSPEAP